MYMLITLYYCPTYTFEVADSKVISSITFLLATSDEGRLTVQEIPVRINPRKGCTKMTGTRTPIFINHAIVAVLDFAINNGAPQDQWMERYERINDANLFDARDAVLDGLNAADKNQARKIFNKVLKTGVPVEESRIPFRLDQFSPRQLANRG